MNTPQDRLTALLAAWRVTPARDPAFRQNVWRRIEAARGGASWAGFARTHAVAVAGALALALLLGGFAGRAEARARSTADSARMADAYVQSLDARTMRMP
jgi:hypothetical protein